MITLILDNLEPFLLEYAHEFTNDDFEKIAETFCIIVLTSSNTYLIVELCVTLISKFYNSQYKNYMGCFLIPIEKGDGAIKRELFKMW